MVMISDQMLGEGPVATVYLGSRADVPVAVKVFPRRFDRATAAAFERERVALAGLAAKRGILPVDGVERLPGGRHALRMQRCRDSLATLVERAGPLPTPEVTLFGAAAAAALAAAHGVGIVHGGVTPHNVLFRESGEPVLADFGMTLRHAFPRDPLHAIEFLPPEAVRTGRRDEQSDLYGLGAVLHFALTGRSPHPGRLGEPPHELARRVLTEPVPAINRSDVPIALSTVIARMLASDPVRRPRDATSIAAQLAAIAPPVTIPDEFDDFPAPQGIQSRPASVGQPGYGGAARYLVAAGVAAVLCVLAVVLLLVFRSSPNELTAQPPVPLGSGMAVPNSTPVRVELAEPDDRGDHVVLSWQGTKNLEYRVLVAAEGEQSTMVVANRSQTMTIVVDPRRQYCFHIWASDGNQFYETLPKPIRGATCRP